MVCALQKMVRITKATNIYILKQYEITHIICYYREAIRDGIVRSNCLNNTYNLSMRLRELSISVNEPLYVACSWSQVISPKLYDVWNGLNPPSWHALTKSSLFPHSALRCREERAAVDFLIAMKASKFIGNSVSSFSALAILARNSIFKWSAFYNGGDIPLSSYAPIF